MQKATVFFYGTFMSAHILREHGINCEVTRAAQLCGYELSIRPRVNLHRRPDCSVFGGLAEVTHRDLESLYGGLRDTFGVTYHPFPVLAQLADETFEPALCYLSQDIQDSSPDPSYVRSLAECAAKLSAPESYIQHILSFLHPTHPPLQ